jgi:hypothetical protein
MKVYKNKLKEKLLMIMNAVDAKRRLISIKEH